jgi:hypothetical protein
MSTAVRLPANSKQAKVCVNTAGCVGEWINSYSTNARQRLRVRLCKWPGAQGRPRDATETEIPCHVDVESNLRLPRNVSCEHPWAQEKLTKTTTTKDYKGPKIGARKGQPSSEPKGATEDRGKLGLG